jgi:molybdenum cofactor biosynthesis protein MoaC
VIRLGKNIIDMIRDKTVPKGDPLEVAKIAAVQAAKNTSGIIPYCHPLSLDHVGVELTLDEETVRIEVSVKAIHRTGVEMEAITAASVAALTVFDMVKMFNPDAEIRDLRILEKRGGKTQFGAIDPGKIKSAVLVLSDSAAKGVKEDRSGKAIVERLEGAGIPVADYCIIPDDREGVVAKLVEYADRMRLDLVLCTGGTGIGPRDLAPEALEEVMDREMPGIPEALRAYGQERTPFAMLSRGRAGLRGKTLFVTLPGSLKAVEESLQALFPGILHAFAMIRGEGHSESDSREKGIQT